MDDLRRLKPIGPPLQGGEAGEVCVWHLATAVGLCQLFAAVRCGGVRPGRRCWRGSARCAATQRFHRSSDSRKRNCCPGAHHLLAGTRPFSVIADFSRSFEHFRRECRDSLEAWKTRRPYPRDAVMRHALLNRPQGWADFATWPVTLELPSTGDGRYRAPDTACGLTFAIAGPAGEVRLAHGWRAVQCERAAAQLATLAQDCLAKPWASLGSLALLPQAELAALRNELWGPEEGLPGAHREGVDGRASGVAAARVRREG